MRFGSKRFVFRSRYSNKMFVKLADTGGVKLYVNLYTRGKFVNLHVV
jgi:hypothetical protein